MSIVSDNRLMKLLANTRCQHRASGRYVDSTDSLLSLKHTITKLMEPYFC